MGSVRVFLQRLGGPVLHAKTLTLLFFPKILGSGTFGTIQPWWADKRAQLDLALLQEVWERPAVALGQAQYDDDGEDGEEGQDEVVEIVEVSLEVHQAGGGPAGVA